MDKIIHRIFSTLCVGLLICFPAFAKEKRPKTKPAPPEAADSQSTNKTKSTAPSQPSNESSAPKQEEANAPSGGGGW